MAARAVCDRRPVRPVTGCTRARAFAGYVTCSLAKGSTCTNIIHRRRRWTRPRAGRASRSVRGCKNDCRFACAVCSAQLRPAAPAPLLAPPPHPPLGRYAGCGLLLAASLAQTPPCCGPRLRRPRACLCRTCESPGRRSRERVIHYAHHPKAAHWDAAGPPLSPHSWVSLQPPRREATTPRYN